MAAQLAPGLTYCVLGHRQWSPPGRECGWCRMVEDGGISADEARDLSTASSERREPVTSARGLLLASLTILPDVNGASLRDAACVLAELGFPVFPCEPNGKRPHYELPRPAAGAPGGLYLATTDVSMVDQWWAARPDSNIGLRTGIVFDALDVDVKNGAPGWVSAHRLNLRGLLAGAFAQQVTPSAGGHLLFAPSGTGNKAAGGARHGLDYRGSGGYVLAAPSVIDGCAYAWQAAQPERYGPPLIWDAVVAELAPARRPRPPGPSGASRGVDALVNFVSALEPGNRNDGLYWAASRAVEDGHDPMLLLPSALSTGLHQAEAVATLRSAAMHGAST